MAGVRLGFWNRLALVVGVLATFIIPSWSVLSSNLAMSEAKQSGHVTCLGAANGPDAIKLCDEIWLSQLGYYGWGYWWLAVVNTIVAVVIVYLLIWAGVATIKWIWRGRA